MSNFTLGCDPEVFLHDGLDFISAHGLFPGTKKNPHKLDKGAVQVDGMALEFNIDPAKSEDEFVDNIETVKRQLEEMVSKVDPMLRMMFTPVANFRQDYFLLQPYESKLLGCEPDYDFRGNIRQPSGSAAQEPFRTAAGHVHIGWRDGGDPLEPTHFETCKKYAASFINVGPYVAATPEEKTRYNLYGFNSPFRPKPYGVELRSPSNLWVANEGSIRRMYQTTMKRLKEI